MSYQTQRTLNNEDYDLAKAYELGHPLHMYRLNISSIRFFQRMLLIIILAGIIVLIPTSIFGVIDWYQLFLLHQQHPNTIDEMLHLQAAEQQINDDLHLIFSPFLDGCAALALGVPGLCMLTLEKQHVRLLLCEKGLLQVRWNQRIDTLYWQQIYSIKKEFLSSEHTLYGSIGKLLTLKYYQDMDDLIAQIRELSGIPLD